MDRNETIDLGQPKPEESNPQEPFEAKRGSSLWWFIWMPAIVAVVLWIGGWWFGNYGGPWQSRPRYIEPKIKDSAVATLHFEAPPSGQNFNPSVLTT